MESIDVLPLYLLFIPFDFFQLFDETEKPPVRKFCYRLLNK
jgi:hypothetical protein